MNKKVVLAYSGGLDTSVAVRWLSDKGYDVVAYMADVGQGGDFQKLKKRALSAGSSKVVIEDLKEEFAEDFAFQSLKAGAVYESKYLLATALSRPIIAKGMVETAKKEKAGYVAHGCTGKGNDQVRFEVTVMALAPELEIIAPLREWNMFSREEEIEYANEKGIDIDVTKKSPYSLDQNIWGISIECGVLEDPWNEPPEDAYKMTKDPKKAPNKPTYVDIEFKNGVPVKINNKKYDPVDLVVKLNEIGGKNGIGRTDLVENRLVGIKSREIYEAPGAWILHKAHKDLEALVLDRELLHFKESISLKYAELVYYGLWFTPLKKALDAFINETQKKVTGVVKMKLLKGVVSVAGRRSPYSLYKKEMATYEAGDKFDRSVAEGFIKVWGMPYKK
ncbi:MAG: argininosuccinate synthase [Candidatus Omnitrophica bacterium]|nr:argininosuccinate synthase [Candidatus Omnitrophota bacterium]MBU4589862.1 argininosuccinate synthase [Candidatus Omnitrophota bacterium]